MVINLLDEYQACATTPPEAGGTWTGPTDLGALTGDNPQIDTSLGTFGEKYMYTYTGGVCPKMNILIVGLRIPPDAGLDNTIDLCVGDPIVDVFSQLLGNPQTGGIFSGAAPEFSTDGTMFDPTTAGTFTNTYTVIDVIPSSPVCNLGSCPDATATITFNVTPIFQAGDGAQLSVCG